MTTKGTVSSRDITDDPTTDAFRRRLLEGLAASIEERGYHDSTVADIVRQARTSRRTFYQHFDSKEECFAALLMETSRQILASVTAAIDPAQPWQTQIRQAIEAWFRANEARPALTMAWVREAQGLGSAASTLQQDMMAGFIDLVLALSDTDEFRATGAAPVSRPLAILLLGGLRELTATFAEQGRQLVDVAVDATIALLGPRADGTRTPRDDPH